MNAQQAREVNAIRLAAVTQSMTAIVRAVDTVATIGDKILAGNELSNEDYNTLAFARVELFDAATILQAIPPGVRR